MLGGSVGAVSGCQRLESSVVYVLDVGEVRIHVGGLVVSGSLAWHLRVRQRPVVVELFNYSAFGVAWTLLQETAEYKKTGC